MDRQPDNPLESLEASAEGLGLFYRVVGVLCMVSIPIGLQMILLNFYPEYGAILLFMPIILGFLTWIASSYLKQERRAFEAMKDFVSSSRDMRVTKVWKSGLLSFHPFAEGSVRRDGARSDFTVEMELEPGRSSKSGSTPPMFYMRTSWVRPDDLLVARCCFYADLEPMRKLQEFAFRKDLWRGDIDGLFTDRGRRSLTVQIEIDEEEGVKHLAARMTGAFEALCQAAVLSVDPPGRILQELVESKPSGFITDYFPYGAFGFDRVRYCKACLEVPGRAAGKGGVCPDCLSPLVTGIVRANRGAKGLKEKSEQLRAFVSGSWKTAV